MESKLVETTVSIDIANKAYLDHIASTLNKPLKSINGIATQIEGDSRAYMSLAYPIEHHRQISAILKNSIGKILAVSYKKKYLKDRLNLISDSLVTKTLLNTMCIFDSHVDSKAVNSMFEDVNNYAIDGIYNFRLKNMKRKWDEIIEVSNANDIIFSDESIVMDFLRFLVEAIPFQNSEMSVVFADNEYTLFDQKNKKMPTSSLIYDCVTIEEELLYNIICQKPKKLVFYGENDNLSGDFYELCEYLFSDVIYK